MKFILDFVIYKFCYIIFFVSEGCFDLMVIMVFIMIVVGDRCRWFIWRCCVINYSEIDLVVMVGGIDFVKFILFDNWLFWFK